MVVAAPRPVRCELSRGLSGTKLVGGSRKGRGRESQVRIETKKKKREGGESELFLCARAGEKRENGEGGEDLICLCSDPPLPSPSRFRASPIVFCSLLLPRCLFFPLQVLFFRGNSSGRNRDKVSRGERRPYVVGCSAVQQLELGGGGPKEPPEAKRALRRAGEVSPPPYVAAWGDTAGLRVTGIYDDSGRKGGRGFLVFPHFSSSFSPPLLPASKSAPGKR